MTARNVLPIHIINNTPEDGKGARKPALVILQKNKKRPTKNGWHPGHYTVDLKTNNYGILCGPINNLIAIDIDLKQEGDCLSGEVFRTLFKKDLNTTFATQTPSGGYHYYFQYHEKVHSNKTKIVYRGKQYAVDIRSHRGYIIGPGSAVTSDRKSRAAQVATNGADRKTYTIINDVPVAKLTTRLVKALSQGPPRKKGARQNKTDEYVDLCLTRMSETIPLWENYFTYKEHTVEPNGAIKINMNRQEPAQCDTCNRTHQVDNTVYLLAVPSANKLFRGCTRKKNVPMKFVCFVKMELGVPVRKGRNDKLIKAIKKIENMQREDEDMKLIQSFERVGVNVINYNKPHCSDSKSLLRDRSTIVGQRACKGVGKTYAASKRFKLRYKPHHRVLILSYRISLSEAYKTKYKVPCYLDGASPTIEPTTPHIIVQIDSLHRVNWNAKNCAPLDNGYLISEIIIDEIHQIRNHFTSHTFLTNPSANRSWLKFKYFIQNTRHIMIMDADIRPEDFEFIRNIRADGSAKRIAYGKQLLLQRKRERERKTECKNYVKEKNKTERNNNTRAGKDIQDGGFDDVVETENITMKLYWNTYDEMRARVMNLTSNRFDIVRKIEDDLKAGRKFYLANNGSTKKLISLFQWLSVNYEGRRFRNKKKAVAKAKSDTKKAAGVTKVMPYNILIICSDTLEAKKTKAALKDPNKEFGKYDGIMVSPSVQAGLSYDVKNTIHTVYGIFENFTNSSTDCRQMLPRIRHPMNKNSYISVSTRGDTGVVSTKEEITKYLATNRENITNEIEQELKGVSTISSIYTDSHGIAQFTQNDFFKLYVSNKEEQEEDRSKFVSNFIRESLLEGYSLKTFDMMENNGLIETDQKNKLMSKGYRAILKEIETMIDSKRAEDVASAAELRTEEVLAIKRKHERHHQITKQERNGYRKAKLKRVYGIQDEVEIKDKEWVLMYGNDSVIRHYLNLKTVLNESSYAECIKYVHTREVKKDRAIITKNQMPEHNSEEAMIQNTIDKLLNEPKSKKYEIIFGILRTMGFNSLLSKTKYGKGVIKNNLIRVFNKYIVEDGNNTYTILGKKKSKLYHMRKLKTDSPTFSQCMLQFVNGLIATEWGIRIVKPHRHAEEYQLSCKHVAKNIFIITKNTDEIEDQIDIEKYPFGNLTPRLVSKIADQ